MAFPMNNQGSCLYCDNMTEIRCQRCGDFYCNVLCQRLDWPNHRYVCFPIPPLIGSQQQLYNESNICSASVPGVFVDNTNVLYNINILLKSVMERLRCLEDNIEESSVNSADTRPNNETQRGTERHTNDNNHVVVKDFPSTNVMEDNLEQPTVSCGAAKKSSNNHKNVNDRVIVTGFRATNLVGIRSDSVDINDSVKNMQNALNEYAKKATPLKSMPEVNSYAVAKKDRSQYGRVQVLTPAKQDRIWVFFYDHGSCVKRQLGDLFEMSQYVRQLPVHTKIVQLDCVESFSVDFKLHMNVFENKTYLIKYKNDNVELFDCKTGNKLNDEINKLQKNPHHSSTTLRKKEQNTTRTQRPESVPVPPLKTVSFEVDCRDIDAVILDRSFVEDGYLLLACIKKEHWPLLTETQQFLRQYNFSHKFHTPKVGEHCIADFEGDWYRAKVLSVRDGGMEYEVVYTDFMNKAILTSDKIRRYPDDLRMDCYTNSCFVYGLPRKLNSQQVTFLMEDVNEIHINRIRAKKKDEFFIECSAIVEAVENLARN